MIAERTRDKMSAARRKGKWVGGVPVLGYDVSPKGRLARRQRGRGRTRPRHLRYVSGIRLVDAGHQGTGSPRLGTEGVDHPQGNASRRRAVFARTRSTTCSSMPLYLGKVNHRGQLYDGEQPQIVEHRSLAARAAAAEIERQDWRIRDPEQIWRDAEGHPPVQELRHGMIHTYTKKTANKLYRYYVCVTAHQHGWNKCPTRSVSAPAIEEAVVAQIRGIGATPP